MPQARHRVAPSPGAELVPTTVKLQSIQDVEEADGGYVFEAIAQFYELCNDRLMIFEWGSGAKTIAERVPAGRVKIHSGHPWDPNHHTIVGKVLEARESREDGGVWYRGFLSGSEEALATKLREGVIDENSLELHVLREADREVPIDQIPEHARRWVEVAPSGMAMVRAVKEWRWDALGLVSGSSQGRRALLVPPTLVPYQDLPLASADTAWEPKAARRRVESWAGLGRAGADEAKARLSRAFLARSRTDPYLFLGQIADVVDGELVAVPAALQAALEEVEALLAKDPATAVAAARMVGRYEARLTGAESQAYHPRQHHTPEAAGEPAEPLARATSETIQPTAGPGIPPTERAGTDEATAELSDQRRDEMLRELQLDTLDLGLPRKPEVGDVPDRPGSESPP